MIEFFWVNYFPLLYNLKNTSHLKAILVSSYPKGPAIGNSLPSHTGYFSS